MRNLLYTISRICLIGILLVATGPSVQAQGGQKEKGLSHDVAFQLQEVLNKFVNDPAHPYVGGMSAAIKVDNLAFWQGAAGYAARDVDAQNNPLATGTPFTPTTPSQIYSVTKSFTAALVMELVNEGVLNLNGRVIDYIPFIGVVNGDINPNVTIHQLMAHETGYSDFWLEPQLQGAIAMYPTYPWQPLEALSFVQQLQLAPGTRSYSSSNYIMLGAIVELVTSKTIQAHYRERFFTPLQLNSMYLRGRETPIGGAVAAPHDDISPLNFILQPMHGLSFPEGTVTNISALPFTAIEWLAFTSGGIVSNVADVAEWGSALFGGRATSKATLDAMIASIDDQPDEDGDYLGYGIWKTTKISKKDVFIGHDGNAVGYRSVMFHQPEKKLTIAILTNDRSAKLYEVAAALYKVLEKDFFCDNGNTESRVWLCYKGKMQCVAQSAAPAFLDKGAVIGPCELFAMQQAPEATAENSGLTSLRAYPNPVNNRSVFSFQVEQGGQVSLRLYDMNGRLVSTLFEGAVEKGEVKQVVLERGSLPGGIYFGRLHTPAGISQHKLVLNR